VTSVRRDNRHIVAVVLGGSSAGARDARMRELISEHMDEASTRHTATMVAEAAEPAPAPPSRSLVRAAQAVVAAAAPAAASASRGYALATVSSVSVPPPVAAAPVQGPVMVAKRQALVSGSTDPIRPIAVKTIKVKIAPIHTASLAPAAVMIPIADETSSTAFATAPAPAPAPAPKAAPPQPAVHAAQLPPAPRQEPVKPAALQVVAAAAPPAEPVAPAPAAKAEPAAPPTRSLQVHNGWIVQVGAFGTESEAKQHLDAAQSKAKSLLGHADPFTETVTKGDKTFYRARFAGLEREQAEATCRQLRRSDIACMTVKN
jgi:D-alanyl-D-alanine carboxypeptidase